MADSLKDPFLGRRLGRRLPAPAAQRAEIFLEEIERNRTALDRWASEADANPPVLRTHDRFGDRCDEVDSHPSFAALADIAYGRFGLVAMAYDPASRVEFGGYPRSVAFAGGASFALSEQGLYCPLCMTDGAVRILSQAGEGTRWADYIARLTSRAPDRWTGGMFLTERQGGSDVGASTCAAIREGDTWRLHGEKWFCSNAGADLPLVLARPVGAGAGTRGLGLFAMPRVLPDGRRNSYLLRRLKDKLGTRSMATAEVELNGAEAYLVGPVERGFVQMAEMINLSRLYNSVASVAILGRAYVEARDWASEREAFGRPLANHPMVRDTLEQLAAELDGVQAFVWEIIGRVDRVEGGQGSEADRRLIRMLTPLAKLYTARRAVWGASEAIEILGGNGYVEEFPLPRLLRDAQVLPIWEGTTNIQTLDVFRAIRKEAAHEPLFSLLRGAIAAAPRETADSVARLAEHLDELESALAGLRDLPGEGWTVAARDWAFRLAPAVGAALLLGETAVADPSERAGLARRAERLVDMHLEGWTAVGLLRRLETPRQVEAERAVERSR